MLRERTDHCSHLLMRRCGYAASHAANALCALPRDCELRRLFWIASVGGAVAHTRRNRDVAPPRATTHIQPYMVSARPLADPTAKKRAGHDK